MPYVHSNLDFCDITLGRGNDIKHIGKKQKSWTLSLQSEGTAYV